jgi:DNA-binding CsgD family transcriptional regulator
VTQNDLSLFVYETIGNPRKRHDFLATFAEIIGVNATAIVVEDRQCRWATFYSTYGMDRATINSYSRYYVGVNPYASRRSRSPGVVSRGSEVLSDAEFLDSEYYHGWYKPRGWRHPFTITLDATETTTVYLLAVRPPSHPFIEKEMAILNGLAPHLAQATRIQKRLMAMQDTINRLREGAVQSDVLARFQLSPTESRIAAALTQAQSVKEIAHKADLKADTVRWHVKNIYKKLGVHSRPDFMRLFQELSRQ